MNSKPELDGNGWGDGLLRNIVLLSVEERKSDSAMNSSVVELPWIVRERSKYLPYLCGGAGLGL